MSYFPTPTLSIDTPDNMDSLAYDTPTTPAPSHNDAVDWLFRDHITDRPFSHDGRHFWSGHTTHRLGVTLSPPQDKHMESVTLCMLPRTTSQTWLGQHHMQTTQATTGNGFRKNSWTEGRDPTTTLLPSTFWNPSQEFHAPSTWTHPSPAQSDYSVWSETSCASSPHARSGGYVRANTSPFIKAEEPEWAIQPTQRFSKGSPAVPSMSVRPGDLVPDRPAIPTFPVGSYGTPILDSQFAPFTVESAGFERVAGRRSFSSEDVRITSGDERQKRGFTKPENAIYQCEQCGKLFQRIYNLKAHVDTHDPFRTQPYECPYPVCAKRFVRRTDLTRHEQSVHLKARNHACPRCDASFARKDTLTRHTDDGCPKRTEMKKRVSKSRRSSSASSSGQLAYRLGHDSFSAPSLLCHPVATP